MTENPWPLWKEVTDSFGGSGKWEAAFTLGSSAASRRRTRWAAREIAPTTVLLEPECPEAACTAIVARHRPRPPTTTSSSPVADHHPRGSGRGPIGKVGAGPTEAAGVLVHVQQNGETAVQVSGTTVEVGGDVAEHRGGELGIGTSPAEERPVHHFPTGRGEGPGGLVAVRGCVHARVQRPPLPRTAAGDLHQQPHQVPGVVVQAAVWQGAGGEPVLQHAQDGAVVIDSSSARVPDQLLGKLDHGRRTGLDGLRQVLAHGFSPPHQLCHTGSARTASIVSTGRTDSHASRPWWTSPTAASRLSRTPRSNSSAS